jgi:RNA polymerase sigma factor (sigma-70 family)
VNGLTDQQLLRDYTGRHSEEAFAELVRRHLDFVHSAALRMVRNAHLAEDVSQGVFVALAQNAEKLTDRPVLSGWLHRTAQNFAANIVRSDVRRRAREQEAAAMNELLATEPDALWEHIAPQLDAALGELSESDRDALLLRYFERKSAHEMAQTLGVSDEAAQKRVNRAVDRLREFFAKRGVTVGAGGLVVVISANAVQAAPAGLAATISTAATAFAGTTLATTATATKAIAMTTLQKTLIAVTIIAVGAGIYEARQASRLRVQVQTLQQQIAPLSAQIQQLQRERSEATNRLGTMNEENARLKSGQNLAELLKLRGEVGVLRQLLAAIQAQSNSSSVGLSKLMSDPAMREYIHQNMLNVIKSQFGSLFKELKLTPEQTEKIVQVMGDLSMKHIDAWYSLPQGTLSPTEIAQTRAEQKAELETQLQPLLGETGCARLMELLEEAPGHATVELLNGQLGVNQINDDQSTRLFQIVKAEPFDLTRGISGELDPAFWGSQDDIDNHLLQVAESNQRILQQAGSFLTPDQLAALNTVLTNGVNARITQAAALIQKH